MTCTRSSYRCAALAAFILSFVTPAAAQQTTTWSAIADPNTSNNSFTSSPPTDSNLWTNHNNHTNLNISTVNIHALTGNFAGKIYAHVVPWFDPNGSSHFYDGEDSSSQAVVDSQIDALISRGIDGVIINWYGPNNFVDRATLMWRDRILARGLGDRFVLSLMIDKGAISGDPTARLQSLVRDTVVPVYENTMGNAYLRDAQGRPFIYFFDVQQRYTIDWAAVRSAAPGQLFMYEGESGFTTDQNQADGAFAWLDVTADPYGYVSWWYGHNTNGRFSTGTAYKGFDDWPVHCWGQCPGSHRFVDQRLGVTWLETWRALREHPNAVQAVQLVTYTDYEEGTALEIGIDNGLQSVDISGSGSVVSWTPNFVAGGTIDTVHHFTVWAKDRTTGTIYNASGDLPNSARSFDLATSPLPQGSYEVYVQAVGQPFITNRLSPSPSPFMYDRSTGGACGAPVVIQPTSGETVSGSVRIQASAPNCSSIAAFIDNVQVAGATGGSLDQTVPVSAGPHQFYARSADGTGTNHQSATLTFTSTTTSPPIYDEIISSETAWIRSAQIAAGHGSASGAIVQHPSSSAITSTCTNCWAVIPYDSNIAAQGLLDGDSTSGPVVKAWMQWYFSHLNRPDYNNVTGTVYDYLIDANTYQESYKPDGNGRTPAYDSTDSYAATFLSLARKYYDVTQDGAFLIANQSVIGQIAGALEATLDHPINLTRAKPDYPAYYLMDNSEVYRGLADAAYVYRTVLNDSTTADRYQTEADQVKAAIEASLWDANADGGRGTYEWADGNPSDWSPWYDGTGADTTAQMWPLLSGVLQPADARASNLYNRMNELWLPPASSSDWTALNNPDGFPWAAIALAAAKLGDGTRLETYMTNAKAKYTGAGHPWTWNVKDAGQALDAAVIGRGGNPPPGVTVTVTSPANNANVTSPVTIAATASSSSTITGWHIYVNGNDRFSGGQTTAISASVPLDAGTNTVIVRAWDSTGAFGDRTLTLNNTPPE